MAAMRASTLMGTTFAAACLAAGGACGAATARAASVAYRSAACPAGKRRQHLSFKVKERFTEQVSAPPFFHTSQENAER